MKKIPRTKKINVVDKIKGYNIVDSYRWLENSKDKKVKNWIDAQNKYSNSFLKNDTQKTISKELIKNFKVGNVTCPDSVGGRYFYLERQPHQDQMVLYYKKGLNGKPIKLVDPNSKRKGSTTTIDYWLPCWSGKYIIYGLSKGGDEMSTLYIMNVDKKNSPPVKIANCSHSSIQWLPDDSGFYYTKNPRPGSVPKNELRLHTKVYFHKLGNSPNNDKLIFGKNRPKDDMIGLSLSIDGKYLAIHASRTWSENEIYIYNRINNKLQPLIVNMPFKFTLHFLPNKAVLRTNYKANNFRLLSISLNAMTGEIRKWKEFCPEQKHLLKSVWVTKNSVLLEYLKNACSEVIVLNHSGRKTNKVPLPEISSIIEISTRETEKEFFYKYDSFTFPSKLCRFNPKNNHFDKYKFQKNPINPNNYSAKQKWFLSKDGTKIPIFIFHKKGVVLNSKNPTLLYGYGGFGINETPAFLRPYLSWFKRGGIFAIANIRGGGEFGELWHKSGIKKKKQNSFNDFIKASEFLISQKYTDQNHLGIIGGSNGGLLVSAVAVQRPDLFKAVCARVPLTDMVRFSKFGIAMRWIHEYGNPEIGKELKNILKWSPYHNVKNATEYPNILFTTATNDTRVDPLHARKMTALLQSVNKQNKILIYTETNAGHGQGKPISKFIEVQSLILTFFSKELDLKF